MEERERLKREARERQRAEELEEERKLQAERDKLQKQFDLEQQKLKQKEVRYVAHVISFSTNYLLFENTVLGIASDKTFDNCWEVAGDS